MRLIVRKLPRKAGGGDAFLALRNLAEAITTQPASPILEFNQVQISAGPK